MHPNHRQEMAEEYESVSLPSVVELGGVRHPDNDAARSLYDQHDTAAGAQLPADPEEVSVAMGARVCAWVTGEEPRAQMAAP